MKIYLQRPTAMALLFLIYLLTFRAGDAATKTKLPSIKRSAPGEIVLEEVIISGSGNNTRITRSTVAEEPSKFGHEILSLLSKRDIHKQRLISDQNEGKLQDATIVYIEDDEDDLERLKRVVAKYEPQRIASRIAKRKIVNAPVDIHDKRVISGGKIAGSTTTGSTTNLENTYHEVLRNISRGIPQLVVNNISVTLSPYLSQAMKNLRQVPAPATTIRTTFDDGTVEKLSHPNVNPSYTLSALKKKLLLKKYIQPNRTSSQTSLNGESKLDEITADINESIASKKYPYSANGNLKDGSTTESPIISPEPMKKPDNRREWHVEDSSTQISTSPIDLPSNNHIFNVGNSNKKQSSLQRNFNSFHSPLKFSKVPRPFSVSAIDSLQKPSMAGSTSIATSYRKPNTSPAEVTHQVHPAGTTLPLVLPTDFFNAAPIRRYIPIQRANHEFKTDRIHTAATSFANANSPGASSGSTEKKIAASESSVGAGYSAPHANVIAATKVPVVATNDRQNPDHYIITENPTAWKTVATTNTAMTYSPSQSSASHILQDIAPRREHILQDIAPKTKFMSGIVYDGSNNDKSDLNENPGIALYNKFAGLYSIPTTDVLHRPKAASQNYENFKQPSLPVQQASALPYASVKPIPLKSISPELLSPRSIVTAKPLAPYYDSSFLLSRHAGELNRGKSDKEDDETNVRSLAEETDEIKADVANVKSALQNYLTQINHGAYEIRDGAKATPVVAHETRETLNEQQRKQDRDEDPYYQRSHGYERQDKYRERHNDSGDKDSRSENARDEDDEEDVDEREGKYVNTRGNKEAGDDRDSDYQYDQYKYDDSEEKQTKKQRYGTERYDNERPHDKYNRDVGVNRKLTDGSRYYDREKSEDDEKYRDGRYKQQASVLDNSYNGKSRRDREHKEHEDESASEDKSVVRYSKDLRSDGQREKYKENSNNNSDKRKYYNHLSNPRTDSQSREQYKYEEYDETNPKHVREEYQHQRHIKGHHHDPTYEDNEGKNHGDKGERDHVHGETQEHVHKHKKHHDENKHGEDHKFETGEGGEHEEEHHGHKGEKGDKGYKVWHEHEKAQKGHHDKEHTSKEYDEKDGKEKKHEEEGGYHEQHNHGEKGEKSAEFGEKGEHQKGHSTKGEHSVHKKDEYEKKTEFFDEFHEDGGTEKSGQHHHGHESKKGGHEKKAHHDAADHEEKHGKQQKYEKGGHHHEHKGHKVHEGHDHHYDHDHKHGEKGAHEHGKKWSFKKGGDGGGSGKVDDSGHKHR